MDWIWHNKEWLFSGAGVALIGAVVAFFVRRRTALRQVANAAHAENVLGASVAAGSNISQTTTINIGLTEESGDKTRGSFRSEYSANPTPAEIFEALQQLPPYQRKAIRGSYTGLKVRWPVLFRELNEINDYRAKKGFTHSAMMRSSGGSIFADMDIERFPRFKIAHRNTQLLVSGTIESVLDDGAVTLVDPYFEFR